MTTTGRTHSLPHSANIHRAELSNGITLLVYENFLAQSVVLSGILRVGSAYEPAAKNGLASLMAGAMMRGNARRDFSALASALEDVGADIDLSAGRQTTSIFGKALAEDLSLLVEILNDTLRTPTFPNAQIERLRGEVLTGLRMRMQDTRFRANRAFETALYPAGHPLHYSTRGTLDTVPTLTRDDMAAFHAAHVRPEGMILVIAGAVKAADAEALVRAHLESWSNPHPAAPLDVPAIPARAQTERVFVPLAGKTQSDLILGTVGPVRSASDYAAANLANSILGQFGMMGRIGGTVREDLGLAYYAYSSLDGGLAYPGAWSVAAGVNPANVELATARIIDEIRRITDEPVSPDELADNQSYFTGRLPLQMESNEGIAGQILALELYGLGLDYLVHYKTMIESLTTSDLLAAARHYLNPDALVIAVAGPEWKAG